MDMRAAPLEKVIRYTKDPDGCAAPLEEVIRYTKDPDGYVPPLWKRSSSTLKIQMDIYHLQTKSYGIYGVHQSCKDIKYSPGDVKNSVANQELHSEKIENYMHCLARTKLNGKCALCGQ